MEDPSRFDKQKLRTEFDEVDAKIEELFGVKMDPIEIPDFA